MVDKNNFKELEKLAPEERIKRLKELEAAIEQERSNQLNAAKALIDKSTEEIEQETEEEKIQRLFQHIEEEESLEETVSKQKADTIEGHVEYAVPANEVDNAVINFAEMYKSSEDANKKVEVKESYQQGVVDTASDAWKQLGYAKPMFK